MIERLDTRAAAAVQHVALTAGRHQDRAVERLSALGVDHQVAEQVIDDIRSRGRLTLNFHPDRRDSEGRTVAAGLLADGRYRSQYETGISNGGRFAVPGGPRTHWETSMFDGAYDVENPEPNIVDADNQRLTPRPIYGALDLFCDPYGGSPRFGSSFVALETSCFRRATFCLGDSHLGPRDIGTIDSMLSVLAGALESCAAGDGFGRSLSANQLLRAIGTGGGSPSARELDRYIEMQVHGPVELSVDVATIYLDPSFADTAVHRDLQAAAERYGFDLAWSEGSEVSPEVLPDDFRGSEIVALAKQTVRPDGFVDAATIGRALADQPFTPPSPEGDREDSPLQRYKKLWHCCLKFGVPPDDSGLAASASAVHSG